MTNLSDRRPAPVPARGTLREGPTAPERLTRREQRERERDARALERASKQLQLLMERLTVRAHVRLEKDAWELDRASSRVRYFVGMLYGREAKVAAKAHAPAAL